MPHAENRCPRIGKPITRVQTKILLGSPSKVLLKMLDGFKLK